LHGERGIAPPLKLWHTALDCPPLPNCYRHIF